jgi:hypothetical protein
MKFIRAITMVSIFTLMSSIACAADKNEHKAHHPDVSPSSTTTTLEKTNEHGKEMMAKMESQMQKMHEMHEKMTNAKTPEARKALMADHMKAMQDGMSMMEEISKKEGMKMMSGMPKQMEKDKMNDMKDAMKCDMDDMAAHHEMMEKRMQMMESVMQMMMDRM